MKSSGAHPPRPEAKLGAGRRWLSAAGRRALKRERADHGEH